MGKDSTKLFKEMMKRRWDSSITGRLFRVYFRDKDDERGHVVVQATTEPKAKDVFEEYCREGDSITDIEAFQEGSIKAP